MNILYLAPIKFDFLKQRPQYIAEELSKKHNVFYVEPTIAKIAAIRNKELSSQRTCYDISETLHVVRVDGTFALPYKMKFMDKLSLFAYWEYQQLQKNADKIDMIWVGYPGWYDVVRHFRNIPVVYDIMDDHVLLTRDVYTRKYIAKACERLEKTADMIITSARLFYQNLSKIRKNVFLIPNALPNEYKEGFESAEINKDKITFCYVGAIAEWFDNESIVCIAEAAHHQLVLVGPVSIQRLERENIKYVGKVPKVQVADYIKKSDVCLYPFVSGELLDTINPVKIYEYLAFNKPVIAKRSLETEELKKNIYLYSDIEELHQILQEELEPPFKNREEYEEFINRNTWLYRGKQVEEILEEIR